MDLAAVRTFVAVVEAGRFQEAAVDLSVSQQAVSKRVAALERDLGVRLLTRGPRGVTLTAHGRAFLPHARELLQAERRAVASVRRGGDALRVDVIGVKLAPAELLRDFHRAHPEIQLDVVTHFDAAEAVEAVRTGATDASFRAVTMPAQRLPDEIATARVYDEPLQLLTGPSHRLASAGTVTPGELAGHWIWMPGIVSGTEWAAYYGDLAAAFGFTIDTVGPNFGTEPLLDAIADSSVLATFVGELTRMHWPAEYDLRRITVHGPTPVYPHSLLWRVGNPHPGLAALREHLDSRRPATSGTWTPAWAA